MFKRVVAWGDGWMPVRVSEEQVRAGRATLDELAEANTRMNMEVNSTSSR